jgi:hypothetical protein
VYRSESGGGQDGSHPKGFLDVAGSVVQSWQDMGMIIGKPHENLSAKSAQLPAESGVMRWHYFIFTGLCAK